MDASQDPGRAGRSNSMPCACGRGMCHGRGTGPRRDEQNPLRLPMFLRPPYRCLRSDNREIHRPGLTLAGRKECTVSAPTAGLFATAYRNADQYRRDALADGLHPYAAGRALLGSRRVTAEITAAEVLDLLCPRPWCALAGNPACRKAASFASRVSSACRR